MHIKYFYQAQFATLQDQKKPTKNMSFKNKNYNKVNATLDNRNQKQNQFFLKFYIKKA